MENNELVKSTVNDLQISNNLTQKIYTTIKDVKLLFNLDSKVDYKLNDCKGETIKVVDYLIKIIEKDVTDEEGNITKDVKRITLIIDDQGKSYVTASKYFNIQFIKLIQFIGDEEIKKGLIIKIIDTPVKNSNNKALAFELV